MGKLSYLPSEGMVRYSSDFKPVVGDTTKVWQARELIAAPTLFIQRAAAVAASARRREPSSSEFHPFRSEGKNRLAVRPETRDFVKRMTFSCPVALVSYEKGLHRVDRIVQPAWRASTSGVRLLLGERKLPTASLCGCRNSPEAFYGRAWCPAVCRREHPALHSLRSEQTPISPGKRSGGHLRGRIKGPTQRRSRLSG